MILQPTEPPGHGLPISFEKALDGVSVSTVVLKLRVHLNPWKAYNNRFLGPAPRDSDAIELVGVVIPPF